MNGLNIDNCSAARLPNCQGVRVQLLHIHIPVQSSHIFTVRLTTLKACCWQSL